MPKVLGGRVDGLDAAAPVSAADLVLWNNLVLLHRATKYDLENEQCPLYRVAFARLH